MPLVVMLQVARDGVRTHQHGQRTEASGRPRVHRSPGRQGQGEAVWMLGLVREATGGSRRDRQVLEAAAGRRAANWL